MQPDAGLALVHDPEDAFEHAQALRDAAAADPRKLFVPITPGAVNKRAVGNDILKALGKDPDLLGAGRSGQDNWLRALIWLEVSGVQDLYISRAHLLAGRLLDDLTEAALRAGIRLWLIIQAAALARHHRWFLQRWPAQLQTIGEVAVRLGADDRPGRAAVVDDDSDEDRGDDDDEDGDEHGAEQPVDDGDEERDDASAATEGRGCERAAIDAEESHGPSRSDAGPDGDEPDAEIDSRRRLPQVPLDDFTSFRACARGMLSANDFERVDAEFRAAVAQSRSFLTAHEDPDEEMVTAHFREVIADCDWFPLILTRIRGGQVGAFHAGYLVKVNLDVLAAARRSRLSLDREVLAVLRKYGTPRYAALAVLTVASSSTLDEIAAVNLDDVGDDGSNVLVAGRRVELPRSAAAIVDALVRERLSFFAGDNDPLFVYLPGTGTKHGRPERWTARGMLTQLKNMERENGLMLTAHLMDAGQRSAVSWARRTGLSVQKIS